MDYRLLIFTSTLVLIITIMTILQFSVTANGSTYYDHYINGDRGWVTVPQAKSIVEARQPAGAVVTYQGTR